MENNSVETIVREHFKAIITVEEYWLDGMTGSSENRAKIEAEDAVARMVDEGLITSERVREMFTEAYKPIAAAWDAIAKEN